MKKNNPFDKILNIVSGALAMIGMGYIISLCFSISYGHFSPATPALVDQVGSLKAAELTALYLAIPGAVFAGTRFLWKIEDWSLLKSSAAYFGINLVVMLFCGYRLKWFPQNIGGYLSFIIIFIIIYLIIWCIHYFKAKTDAREMNNRLKEMQK